MKSFSVILGLCISAVLLSEAHAGSPVKIDQMAVSNSNFLFHTTNDGCVNGTNQWYRIDSSQFTNEEQRKAVQSLVLMAYAAGKNVVVSSDKCDEGYDPIVIQVNVLN